ncbi:transposase [Streptomyces sp. NPDC055134]
MYRPVNTSSTSNSATSACGPGQQSDLRETPNAILYVNRTGIRWECLLHDFPPSQAREHGL